MLLNQAEVVEDTILLRSHFWLLLFLAGSAKSYWSRIRSSVAKISSHLSHILPLKERVSKAVFDRVISSTLNSLSTATCFSRETLDNFE